MTGITLSVEQIRRAPAAVDIQHHAQLKSAPQVISRLNLINGSFLRTRPCTDLSFYVADDKFCFIATQTQQSIRRLRLEILARGAAR